MFPLKPCRATKEKGLQNVAPGFMIQHMFKNGKQPSWGALKSNTASLNLAKKLGFVPVAELYLFSRLSS